MGSNRILAHGNRMTGKASETIVCCKSGGKNVSQEAMWAGNRRQQSVAGCKKKY
jgi:hypothetical protein